MTTPQPLLPALIPILLITAGVDAYENRVLPHASYGVSREAATLHQSLTIGDLHADSLLWGRDLSVRNARGHVDLPRLREGNVALQMFTTPTKSPLGQNYDQNSRDAFDMVNLLAFFQGWPMGARNDLTERALLQASRLDDLTQERPEEVRRVRTRPELEDVLADRKLGSEVVGALLGIEGAHALEGDLDNVRRLYDAGFRMMGLHHFFDNELGGSQHGESGAGLSDFGKQALREMRRLGVMIDVSHSSEQTVRDVFETVGGPLLVSHTGFHGHCPSHRNIDDGLMSRIAEAGGLIAVGFWDGAVCDTSPSNIVRAIRYGIDLVGVDHIALGSDFDGGTEVEFDASEIAVLTEEMLRGGFFEEEIRKVMGENLVEFLRLHLPE